MDNRLLLLLLQRKKEEVRKMSVWILLSACGERY